MNLLEPTIVLALLTSGMGAALLGSIKVPLADRLQIGEARIGALLSIFGLTLVPVFLTAGFLTDLLGRQLVLVGGSLLLGASLGLLALARNYLAALVAVIVLSAGWALMINVDNVLTPVAFPGRLSYATNLANVFFGLGALLTPLPAAWLARRYGLMRTLTMLGALCLLPGILALGIDFAELAPISVPTAGGATWSQAGALARDPFLWLCSLALFFYGPLEASVGAWATSYLGQQGWREQPAAGMLSAFWLTFMAARLGTAFYLPATWERPLIVVLSLACVLVLGGLVWGRGRVLGAILIVAAGAVFGPIFPTLIAVFLEPIAPTLHGRAVGMLFAIGGIGWAVIPTLIGAAARRGGLRHGFAVAVGAAVGLSAAAIALLAR